MKRIFLLCLLILFPALLTADGDAGPGRQENQTREDHMSGIVFFKTQKLKELQSFYIEQVGCTLWLDQGGCIILSHGNFLFGFCQGAAPPADKGGENHSDKKKADSLSKDSHVIKEKSAAETCGMLTFFYKDKEAVDRMYKKFKTIATSKPKENPKYDIYHFFAVDPEGRAIEFQYFMNPIDWNF